MYVHIGWKNPISAPGLKAQRCVDIVKYPSIVMFKEAANIIVEITPSRIQKKNTEKMICVRKEANHV